jgi:uncharacterized protein
MTDQKMLARGPRKKEENATRLPLPPSLDRVGQRHLLRIARIPTIFGAANFGWSSHDSRWRNRAEFPTGRAEIVQFLKRKWAKELDHRLIKELWAYNENRIAVRSPTNGTMTPEAGSAPMANENREFDDKGLMRFRFASINDLPIKESERKYYWPLGRRPDEHPGLSDLGL